ncbi:conserved hypothetical protein [Culex quinquefasciatus]|uniref:Uncharacterized protein n=1 Tax=Culex quinquefasciatus TaxID=7176 RepID=B0XLJ2_CULQU|nr:conserved hypothetical protein [Culex quinquefasciatus]|eukprot:XP_001870514.1 conserved hypothetical protein [Culex quinquefasciatus]
MVAAAPSIRGKNTQLCDEDAGSEDDDDMEEEKWLESLGVEAEEIKKINYNQAKKVQHRECDDDYSDQSTVLIEGVECQAFFNFLLNAKSTTTKPHCER